MFNGPLSPRSPCGLALVEEGSMRLAPMLELPALLAELGFDPGLTIAEAGIDPGLFADPENSIPFADIGLLLDHCARRTACPSLGLKVGQKTGLEALGLVGRLAAQSPDLGSALRNIILYLHLHDRGAIPSLWVSGDRAIVAYTIYQPDVPGVEQIYDGALAISFNVMKALAGPGWEATEVRLCRPRPADIEPYRRFFRSRLAFGSEHCALVFPATCLERPLGGANPLAHRQIMKQIESLETQGAGDLPAQLKRVLRRLLVAGPGPAATSLEQIASLFAVHRRTLNRRLRAQGTSFRELIDASRYDIARQLLRDTRLSVLEIATALDYADAAAFTRAFRRWSGTSPAAWRAARYAAPTLSTRQRLGDPFTASGPP